MIKGKHELTLTPGKYRVSYLCPSQVLMSLDDAPMAVLKGSTKTTLTVRKDTKVSLDPTGKEGYKFDVALQSPVAEHTDDVPPPAPVPPSNYLMAVREAVRQSMGIIREEFADHKTIYEVVDDLDVFEEERQAMRQAAASQQDDSGDNSDTSSPPGDAQEASE